MAHRDYYDKKEPVGMDSFWLGVKDGWKDFWFKWVSFGAGVDGHNIGYWKFRTIRFLGVLLVTGLIIISL